MPVLLRRGLNGVPWLVVPPRPPAPVDLTRALTAGATVVTIGGKPVLLPSQSSSTASVAS